VQALGCVTAKVLRVTEINKDLIKVNIKNVKLFLAVAAFGAALSTPATASTISAVTNTGGTATFTSGVLTSISGWNLSSFAGFSDNSADVTITVSSGKLLFTALAGAFTGALSNLNGAGAFLTITLPGASGLSGTQPSLTETYGAGSGLLSAAAAADLSVGTALTNFSNSFVANSCATTCTGTTGSSVNGVFNVSSNTNTYMTTTATPEPGSFFLLGASMLAAVVLYKRKALVPSPAAKQI
jgi:hypothetical protein